jgi:tetratricopeptide (TPR) repeat protein
MSEITKVLDTIQADLDKGKVKEALAALQKVLPSADRSKDPKEHARAHTLLGKVLTRSGDLGEAAKELLKALSLYEEIPDGNGMAETLLSLGVLHRWKSDFATAEEFLDQFLDQASELDNQEQIGQAHTELGIVLAEKAEYPGSISHFKEAIDILKRTPNAYQLNRAYQSLGESYKRKGDFIQAFESLEECIKVAERLGLERNIAYASASAAECLAKGGHVQRADRYIERALTYFKNTKDDIGYSDSLRVHAVVEWKKGDLTQAKALFERAFEALKGKDIPTNEVLLKFDYAEFLLDAGKFEDAVEQADAAIQMARRLGVASVEDRAWSIKNKVKAASKGTVRKDP